MRSLTSPEALRRLFLKLYYAKRRNTDVDGFVLFDASICSLCRLVLSDVPVNAAHPTPFGSPPISRRVKRHALPGILHHNADYFLSQHITCPVCLMLADCLKQQRSGQHKTMMLVDSRARPHGSRAQLTFTDLTTKAIFHLTLRHNISNERPPKPISAENASVFARGALSTCSQYHACKRASSTLPSRVIDIGSTYDSDNAVLFESVGLVAPYIALSHCWGGEIPSRTVKGNLEKRRRKLKLSSLAQNFQDAIEITKKLGVRYIWIDALCIIQDDEEDWMKEAACMADIYSRALLVISASHSAHSESGMFFQRFAPITRNFCLTAVGFEDLEMTHDIRLENFDEDTPINQRAWALQERVTATAVLHVGLQGLFWECQSVYGWEADSSFKQSHPILKSMSPRLSMIDHTSENQHLDLWSTIVSLYTARQLTFRHDKFSAIAGLANLFESQNLSGGRYLAGLWESAIDTHLLWYSRKRCKERSLDLAPSWSWASVNSPIGWFSKTLTDFEIMDDDTCKVDLDLTHVNETNKAAHRMQGDMVIDGLLSQSTLSALQKSLAVDDLQFPWWSMHHPRLLDVASNSSTDPSSSQSALSIIFDGPTVKKFYILRLCSLRFLSGTGIDSSQRPIMSYCLLLELIPNNFGGGSSGLFHRIGIMQIPRDCFGTMPFERTKVTIV